MALGGGSFGKGKCVVVGHVWGMERLVLRRGSLSCGRLEKKKSKAGGADVWLEIGLGLGFFLCFFFKIAFFLCMCWKLLFICKNIVWSPNLVPQLSFFVNFDFA
jgi:hypothetical protein